MLSIRNAKNGEVKPCSMKETNSGLHGLLTIGGEVNKSANDEVLRVSFIVSISGASKDPWLRNAIHYVFYAY